MRTNPSKKQLASAKPAALVAAWQDNIFGAAKGETPLDHAFNSLINYTTDPTEAIDQAIGLVAESDRKQFVADLFNVAGDVLAEDTDGTLRRVTLFTFVVHGNVAHIEQLASRASLQFMSEALITSGVAHASSSLYLCPVPLHEKVVTGISPVGLRYIAMFAARAALGYEEADTASVIQLLQDMTREIAHPKSYETVLDSRVFVGCRVSTPDTGSEDLLDDVEAMGYQHAPSTDIEKATSMFHDSIKKGLDARGVDFYLTGPYLWTRGLADMTVGQLTTNLTQYARAMGVNLAEAEHVHLSSDADAFHVAIEAQGYFIGPFKVSMRGIRYHPELLADFLSSFGDFVNYRSPEELALALAQAKTPRIHVC